MRWTQEREAELTAQIASVGEKVTQLRTQANDLYETDSTWDEARCRKYHMVSMRLAAEERHQSAVKGDLEQLKLYKPKILNRGEEQPMLARFLRNGEDGLTAEENAMRQEAVDKAGSFEMGDAKKQHGVGSGGFMVSARSRQQRELDRLYGAAVVSDDTGAAANSADYASIVETTTQPRMVEYLQAYGGVRQVCMKIPSASGNPLEIPNVDVRTQKGRRLSGQAQPVNDLLPNEPGKTTLNAYTYTSDAIPLTLEMIQDTRFDIVGWVEWNVVYRIGKITAEEFTTGDGNGKPAGVVNNASAGITAASQTAVTWEEMLDLQYEVDAAFLDPFVMASGQTGPEMGGQTGYLMSRALEGKLRRILDLEGRPKWVPSVQAGIPDRIHGYPYWLNFEMVTPAAGAVPCLFGNFSYQAIRTSMDIMVYNFFDSRTARNHGIEVMAFCREDSDHIAPDNADGDTTCPAFVKLTMAT